MHWLISISAFLVLTACTISVTTVHTTGSATDLIDQDQKADAQVSPDINIPALGFDFSVGGRDVGLS